MRKINAKTLAIWSLMIAIAFALSIAERIFPIGAIVPIPGIKLGLANVVTMMALFYIGSAGAFVILVVRCLLGGIFAGISSLFFSLTGGLFAFFAMLFIKQFYKKAFSIFGMSIAGAAFHNFGQITAASAMFGWGLLHTYLPVLLITGLATGILTATVAAPIFRKLERNGFIKRYFSKDYTYFS